MKRAIIAIAVTLFVSNAALDDGAATTQPATDAVPNTEIRIEMVKVPGGEFVATGLDGKPKKVQVKGFWIAKYEARWEDFDPYGLHTAMTPQEREVFQSAKPGTVDAIAWPSYPGYANPHRGWGDNGWPAGSISYQNAHYYCEFLNKRAGAKKYRLPTVYEWEYACRCGDAKNAQPMDEKQLDAVAWFAKNSDEERTHGVGQKQPNAWGLYDMLGNVAEWCENPEGGNPMACGGSYADDAADVHAAARWEYDPKWQREDPQAPKGRSWMSNGAHVGLRVVREE